MVDAGGPCATGGGRGRAEAVRRPRRGRGVCDDGRTAVQAGNPATPLCDAGKAIKVAPAGSTVVLRGGTHPPTTVNGARKAKPVRVEAAAGETAWVTSLVFVNCSNLLNEFTNTRQFAMRLLNLNGGVTAYNTSWGSDAGIALVGGATKDVTVVGNITDRLAAEPWLVGVEDPNLIGEGLRMGAHDLAGQPRFVDAATGDFRLAAGSPGVNAGTTAFGAPTVDLLGRARGGKPDMGAYERAG